MIAVGTTPRPAPPASPLEQVIDPGQHFPGWYWQAKDKLGKRAAGWTKKTADTLDAALLRQHLASKYHNLDLTDFRCEEKAGPPAIVMPAPAHWYEYGTKKLVAEYLAGLRPLGSTCPLEELPGHRPPQPRPVPLYQRRDR